MKLFSRRNQANGKEIESRVAMGLKISLSPRRRIRLGADLPPGANLRHERSAKCRSAILSSMLMEFIAGWRSELADRSAE